MKTLPKIKIAVMSVVLMVLCKCIEHTGLHMYGYKANSSIVKNTTDHSIEPMRLLVTGGAGFIGFHLSQTLAKRRKHQVVVIDNFNDYYDVRLKMDRAYELNKLHIPVYYDDVCNSHFVFELFETYKFTHVAHLAAQAGVRYSLENPLAYVKANIECQVKLLEVMKHFPEVKLIYASSSSVYGKHSSIPFNLKADTDYPSNMYAVSKKTDELLGYTYCETYNLTSIGLRFFTVYGPWGRPDMAIFKFADNMIKGRTLRLYQASNNASLERDFTYVGDIVSGIIGALQYHPTKCGERFNIGYGGPVKVSRMLTLLQKELNVTAKIDLQPLPPTDLIKTWADTSVSVKLLKFHPATSLEKGLPKFVNWYKSYIKKRNKEEGNDAVNMFYKRLVEEQRHRQNMPISVTDKEPLNGKPLSTLSNRENDTIHIAVSLDYNDILGIPTLINSLLNTSSRSLVFHIVIVNFTKDTMRSYLQCQQINGLQPNQLEIYEFKSGWLDHDYLQYITVQMKDFKQKESKHNHEGQKGSHGNFARFFFHRLMPHVRKIIYMDCDTVANKDISQLWDSIPQDKVVGGIHKNLPYSSKAKKIYRDRYNRSLSKEDTFNAGVFTMNLEVWRANEEEIDENIHFWIKTCVKNKGDMWIGLTQPLMHFGFSGFIHTIHQREYNLNMLGVSNKGRLIDVAKGAILHYNGPLKPWLGVGDYIKYWTKHKPTTCNKHGICTKHHNLFRCDCESGYDGNECQIESINKQ